MNKKLLALVLAVLTLEQGVILEANGDVVVGSDCCPQPRPACCPKTPCRRVCRPRRICCPKPCRTVCRRKVCCPRPRCERRRPCCTTPCAPKPCCPTRCAPKRCCPTDCGPKVRCCRPKRVCCPRVRCCRPKPNCCPRPTPVCPAPACVDGEGVVMRPAMREVHEPMVSSHDKSMDTMEMEEEDVEEEMLEK